MSSHFDCDPLDENCKQIGLRKDQLIAAWTALPGTIDRRFETLPMDYNPKTKAWETRFKFSAAPLVKRLSKLSDTDIRRLHNYPHTQTLHTLALYSYVLDPRMNRIILADSTFSAFFHNDVASLAHDDWLPSRRQFAAMKGVGPALYCETMALVTICRLTDGLRNIPLRESRPTRWKPEP